MKFDLSKFKDKKYVMHCKSKKEAIEFLEYLRKHGYKWCTDEQYSPYGTLWNVYKEKTCYYFNDGTYGSCENASDNCVLLEYSDFDWSNTVLKLTENDNKKFDDFLTSCIGLESVVNS